MPSPQIIIHIAPAGTLLATGGSSLTGHMWITLVDSFSNHQSFGFEPKTDGSPWSDGKVESVDDDNYLNPPYNYAKEITESQYDSVSSWAQKATDESNSGTGRWGEYNGIWNSCIDFTWEAMHHGWFDRHS